MVRWSTNCFWELLVWIVRQQNTSAELDGQHGAVKASELGDEFAEFVDFQMGRAFLPVMPPADDDVAAVGVMAVAVEVAALKFKFDADALPYAGPDFIHGFAVREILLNTENAEAKPAREHAEGEDHAELVYWRVSQRVEFKRRAGKRSIRKTGAAVGKSSGTRA